MCYNNKMNKLKKTIGITAIVSSVLAAIVSFIHVVYRSIMSIVGFLINGNIIKFTDLINVFSPLVSMILPIVIIIFAILLLMNGKKYNAITLLVLESVYVLSIIVSAIIFVYQISSKFSFASPFAILTNCISFIVVAPLSIVTIITSAIYLAKLKKAN